MSLTGRATSSSSSNAQLIINALAEYSKDTGIDPSSHPFATALEQSDSPEAILQLLQQREKAFKEYREGNRRLINCLSPAVKVLQAFSGILGEAVSLVPFSPAKVLFVGIDALLDAASRVSSSYDALLNLFECLGNFLRRLEVYTLIPPTPVMTDIIVKILVEILSVLALATKQIKEGRFKKFAKKLLGDSEIEVTVQRLDRLTQDEARMTVAQTLSVVHGLVGNVKVVMEDREASMGGIRQDLIALHQELHEINKSKRDQLQRDVQYWLSPPDPSTNQNFVSEARHRGTAAWFFESDALAEWKARGSLLWIHGKPGAGKSTLLSAVIQEIEDEHAAGLATMAYYYFDFRDAKKQDCCGLLSSLISQLSSESDLCYNVLSRLYSTNNRGTRKPSVGALKNCMTDMLNLPGQGPVYIIVDALDECPNFSGTPSAREKVLELIEELVELNLPNIHLCVASRPEIDIRMVLEPLTSLKVSLHDEIGQKEDIVKYIESVIYSDRNMRKWKEEDKQLVVDVLSEKADGMFRWIVCQVDRLRRTLPPSIRRVLNDLPKTLDETYRRTLLGIDEEKREYARRLFQCLIVSIRPLHVEELAEILAIQFDDEALPTFNAAWRPANAEQAVMSVCSSLIAVVNRRGHQIVQFAHFSVKEFLTSERLAAAEESISYYHILPEPAHTILVYASLSVLLHLGDKIDRSTISRFPLARYAARYWVDHSRFRSVSSHIQKAMERLFDPGKPHFAAWVWLYDIDHHWIKPMSTIQPERPEAAPLYYTSLCGFIGLVEHLITAHSADVNSRGGSHTTPLHAASVKGHLQVASILLKYGANPNSRDDVERVPLHRVSQGGQLVAQSSLEIARLLVDIGAEVNVTDVYGQTPLHAAAQSGYRDITELILGSGANPDVRDNNQQTPTHVACRDGKLDVARFLMDRGSHTNSRDIDGLFLLHTASGFGHLDIARLLLDRGSDVDVRTTKRWTALHFASRHGRLDVTRLLIERNADVNAQNENGWTALHLASRYRYLDVTRLLIERIADVNAHNENGWTALHLASSNDHLSIAKLLIESGADVNSRNDKQETPLDLASQYGKTTEMSRFLIESGAAVSTRDDSGWTPFHKASYYGHLHIVKFLIECGIDVNIKNGDEETPLYLASRNGKLDIVRFLIEQGADIQIRDKFSWDPLHIASQNGYLDVVQFLINTGTPVDIRSSTQMTPLAVASSKGRVEVGRFLIERGADMNARDNRNWVPLHFASRYGHLDMARLLLDHSVDADIRKDDLGSSLHLASANGQLKVAELLLQRGASVNFVNEKQETPLYQAVWNEKPEISRLLIDHGANMHTADNNGCTLLHAASQRGHLGVVKLLLRRGADVEALNMVNKTAAELAWENGKAEVARFISDYKADANIRNNIRSVTMDSTQHDARDNGSDGPEGSLHAAAGEGNIDVVKSFLEQGINVNSRDENIETPLHRAAAEGNVNVVRLLIERGAEVDSRDRWGWTPLYMASRSGHLEVSRVLVNHGSNVHARQRDHWTPMHISACNGHLGNVKLLLEVGADVHAVNSDSQTPYDLSLQRGNREIAELLREHGALRDESDDLAW